MVFYRESRKGVKMTNAVIQKVSMNLVTQEQKDAWQNVRDHYGPEFSNSGVLFDLVRIKNYEAKGFRSNRDRLNDLDKEMAEVKSMIKEILAKIGGGVTWPTK